MSTGWAGYLDELHPRNAGITEAVLSRARDKDGADPYEWLADPVVGSDSVLDLACGSAPL